MILLPFITLLVIYLLYYEINKGYFGVINLLVLTYLFMACSSLVLDMSGRFRSVFPITFEPMAYLSICFIIVFWGVSVFRDSKLVTIKIESMCLYRLLENFLLIGGFLAILFFLPFAYTAFTGDVSSNRINQVLYGSVLARYGLINSFFSLIANLFILNQVCSFVNLIPRGGKRNPYKAYLLLLSSFSYVVYILAYVGRDGAVFWLMSYGFCFLLFKKFLYKGDLRKLKRFFVLSFILLLIPFMVITFARFSGSIGGPGWQMLDYAGQQVRNFNDHYKIEAPLQCGAFEFPVFVKLIEFLDIVDIPEFDIVSYYSYYLDEDVLPWVFTTFIGSLMIDFGKVGTLAFLFLMSLVMRGALKKAMKTGILDFSNLTYLYVNI